MANQRQESRPPSTLEQTQVPELRRQLRGPALLPAEPGYDVARTVWNAMIDRYPGIIVQAHAPSDIMAGVDFARYHDLEIAVRGGGHNVAGNAVCEGGLMLDLSAMKSVRVDPAARTAHVEPGALLQDLDRETQAHGLATPTGFISETGVSGLTLGGGFGYLSRKWGLTVDNLRAVDMVTAEGKWVRANEAQNPDLFWG
ncbi:MAG TPA: FAD-dependent oxidoreductase, partial [Gammaproteobacteria bacterium]|nr:FAD-dependent oxidoreductase [Gammaproteobacteria bacterium]